MSLYAISDIHLSLGCDKPMDVFPGWDNYVEKLKVNWSSLVADGDTVVIAGDISWGMSLKESLADFQFIHDLPGKKIILKGNHDYWWDTVTKMDAYLFQNGITSIQFLHNNCFFTENFALCGTRGWMSDNGEAQNKKMIAREALRLETSLQLAQGKDYEKLVFLHYPPIMGGNECTELTDVLKKYGVNRCFYGHIHSQKVPRPQRFFRDGIEYDILSCNYLNFTPLKITGKQ